jgi:undecaprenyl-diphosphatase
MLEQLDIALFILINSRHNAFPDAFSGVITLFGSGWVAVPLVGVIITVCAPRRHIAKALLCAAIAGTLAGTVNTQLKRAFDRPRPLAYFSQIQGTAPAYEVRVVGKPLTRRSFPSGHTATVFGAATILAMLFRGFFFLAFVPALLVAWSRVYMGVHFPLDVAGGAVVGTATVMIVIAFWHKRKWLALPLPIRRDHAEQ